MMHICIMRTSASTKTKFSRVWKIKIYDFPRNQVFLLDAGN